MGLAPHSGPQEIAFHAQNQLINLLVEGGVKTTKALTNPSAQSGFFVVKKDAAVLDLARSQMMPASLYIKTLLFDNRHIGPPVPGRHAHAGRQVEHAVHGSALVAAHDDQGLVHAFKGLFNHLNTGGFPLPLQVVYLQLAFSHQMIDEHTLPQGADNNNPGYRFLLAQMEAGPGSTHQSQVVLKVAGYSLYAGMFVGGDPKRGHLPCFNQREVPWFSPTNQIVGSFKGVGGCGTEACQTKTY